MSMQIKPVAWDVIVEPAESEQLRRKIAADMQETEIEKIKIIWVKVALFRDKELRTPWVGPDLFMQAKSGCVVNFQHNGKNHSHIFPLTVLGQKY